jgi:hypothetical protein
VKRMIPCCSMRIRHASGDFQQAFGSHAVGRSGTVMGPFENEIGKDSCCVMDQWRSSEEVAEHCVPVREQDEHEW